MLHLHSELNSVIFFWIAPRVGGWQGWGERGKYPALNDYPRICSRVNDLGRNQSIKHGQIILVLEFQSSNVTL